MQWLRSLLPSFVIGAARPPPPPPPTPEELLSPTHLAVCQQLRARLQDLATPEDLKQYCEQVKAATTTEYTNADEHRVKSFAVLILCGTFGKAFVEKFPPLLDDSNAQVWDQLVGKISGNYYYLEFHRTADGLTVHRDTTDNTSPLEKEEFETHMAESLTQALQLNTTNTLVLGHILHAIESLTFEWNSDWMNAFGASPAGCKTLVDILEMYMRENDLDTVRAVVETMCRLCEHEDGFVHETRRAFLRAGACQLIKELTVKHADDYIASDAICALSANDINVILKFGELGLCEILVELAKTGEVFDDAVFCLAHDDNVERFKRAGALTAGFSERVVERLQGKNKYKLTKADGFRPEDLEPTVGVRNNGAKRARYLA